MKKYLIVIFVIVLLLGAYLLRSKTEWYSVGKIVDPVTQREWSIYANSPVTIPPKHIIFIQVELRLPYDTCPNRTTVRNSLFQQVYFGAIQQREEKDNKNEDRNK